MENKILSAEVIGRRLRILRGIRTRAHVARATGLSQARLGNYEMGLRIPTDEAKVLLSNFYGVSVQEIFFADDNNKTS